MVNRIVLLLISISFSFISTAQTPVIVEHSLKVDGDEAILSFKAKIDKGWHMYSTNKTEDGPTPATLNVESKDGVELIGEFTASPKAIKQHDNMFDADVFFHEGNATFTQKLKITKEKYKIQGYMEYGACNDENCIPPTQVEFNFSGTKEAKDDGLNETLEVSSEEEQTPEDENALNPTENTEQGEEKTYSAEQDLWSPTKTQPYEEIVAGENSGDTKEKSLWTIFILGILGGLVALVTPCVWPIIPMTVSYFLKRGGGVKDAVIYGVSIIVIYLLLGLVVTALFGASALNALSTNAVFNIFFFLLLVVFALSFFGLFEIRLPDSWGNKVDQQADKAGGLLGIFLMAFTLTLVSFSCTGPIVGFLLVEVSTMGNVLGPAIGMFGFALALALPFALFAMFPSWMKQMPKSGSWMDSVKVVLGFIELFFSLKFLSVADMAYGWHILDRDVFLWLWIIIAIFLTLYLIGFKLEKTVCGNEKRVKIVKEKTNFLRWFLALASFLFIVYMIPGLWGAPLKEISAFTPPMSTQHWKLIKTEVEPQFNDYDEGMAYAKQIDKPAFIDFTGYGCVNCRKMEAAVWTDKEVAKELNENFVLIQLFVDDKTPLKERVKVTDERGNTRILRTVGDKWSFLQSNKFGANAQPFYVIVNSEGIPLDGSYGYDEDIDQFLKYLNDGKSKFKEKH